MLGGRRSGHQFDPPPIELINAAHKAGKPKLISGGVRNQLDLDRFLQKYFNDQGRGTVTYKREEPYKPNDLKALFEKYANPGAGITSTPRIEEIRRSFQMRTQGFVNLGKKAKEKGITTIWSFADTPAWLDEACPPDVEQKHRKVDREAWLYTLAELLDVDPTTILTIELSSP